ncbi:iron-sulfur cluster assembly protein [Thermococcus piezophilus]|uniref:iron-sulfur cluster assembly protein n=1 Tax=Thermococcus piezophilus TaxID=1712654 RepID=UPI000B0FF9D6|nr:iron-sulfur cluster assembly protein [Thermococcus piezophilus]
MVEILKKVQDPETGVNIVEVGLVYGLTVEGDRIDVFLLMARSTPECRFCRMLAINVQRKVLRGIVTVLKEEGFNKIRVYNELGLLLVEGMIHDST